MLPLSATTQLYHLDHLQKLQLRSLLSVIENQTIMIGHFMSSNLTTTSQKLPIRKLIYLLEIYGLI